MSNVTIIHLPDHKKGNTFPGHHFYALNPDGTPYNLTGCEIKSAFRKGSPTGPIEQTIELEEGYTMIDEVAGHYFMDEAVFDWDADKYYYDTQITKADETVDTPIAGTWTITQDITPTTP